MLSFFFPRRRRRRRLLPLLRVRWQSVKDRDAAVADESSRLQRADPSTHRRRPVHRLSPVTPLTGEDQSSQLVKNQCSDSFTRPEMVSIVSFFFFFSLLSRFCIYYDQIFACVTHTHTQSARTTIRSCYKSRRNPNRELDRCLSKSKRFPLLRRPETRVDTRESARRQMNHCARVEEQGRKRKLI
jgi:hypothetical protein